MKRKELTFKNKKLKDAAINSVLDFALLRECALRWELNEKRKAALKHRKLSNISPSRLHFVVSVFTQKKSISFCFGLEIIRVQPSGSPITTDEQRLACDVFDTFA